MAEWIEWISVKDRLPEKTGTYLVNVHQETADGDSGDAVLEAWYAPVALPFAPKNIGWTLLNEFYDLTSVMKDEITHWMPFPKPANEEETNAVDSPDGVRRSEDEQSSF